MKRDYGMLLQEAAEVIAAAGYRPDLVKELREAAVGFEHIIIIDDPPIAPLSPSTKTT